MANTVVPDFTSPSDYSRSMEQFIGVINYSPLLLTTLVHMATQYMSDCYFANKMFCI